MMKWYEEKDAENDVIVASRIRLLRNLRDYKFPWKLEEEDAKGDGQFEISDGRSVDEVYQAILNVGMQPVMSDYIYV